MFLSGLNNHWDRSKVIDHDQLPLLGADELKAGWFGLSLMYGGWRRDGIDLPDLTSPFDDIQDDDGDTTDTDNSDIAEILAANLAVRLAPKYGATLNQVTVELAERGEADLRRVALKKRMAENPVKLEVAGMVNGSGTYDIDAG